MQPDLRIPYDMVQDILYRLRRDFEKGGSRAHVVPMMSLITGYMTKFPSRLLIPAENEASGLAPHFIQWLKQNARPGDNDNSEELYGWISNYPA